MIIGGLQSQLWSWNRFQSPMHDDLDILTPKSIGHILDSVGSKCMKFHYNFSKGISLTVRKPIVDARPRHIRLRAEYCNWAKNFKKQLCRQGTLTPPDTWSCPTLGLACVLMSRPFSPELVLSPDLWISNTPRYFSFAYQYKGKQRSVMITQEMCPWIRAEISTHTQLWKCI